MDSNSRDHLTDMGLQADNELKQHMYDASKWTKFISITVFIGCAFLLLTVVLGREVLMNLAGRLVSYQIFEVVNVGILFTVMIIVIAFIIFIYYFLFNFATKIKKGLLSENTELFNGCLKSLKTYFIIVTVLTVIGLINSIFTLFSTNF